MAPLITDLEVIEVNLETTKGTVDTDTLVDVLAEDVVINPTGDAVDRKGTGLYRGKNEPSVIAGRPGECTFAVELRGNGLQGLDIGLAVLFPACGLEKTVEVYQVHSDVDNDETVTIRVYQNGLLKTLYGAAGNVVIEPEEVAGRILCRFTFTGLYLEEANVALPTYAPSAVAPMLLDGVTFTVATVVKVMSSFSLDLQNNVVARPDAAVAKTGIRNFMITSNNPMLSAIVEEQLLSADARSDVHADYLAGSEFAVVLAFTDGTDTITFAIPRWQYETLNQGELDGIRTRELSGTCRHSASGNDSVAITVT